MVGQDRHRASAGKSRDVIHDVGSSICKKANMEDMPAATNCKASMVPKLRLRAVAVISYAVRGLHDPPRASAAVYPG